MSRGPHYVSDAFVRLARNPHRDELTGAIEPRQVGGIALVVFSPNPGALRNERWRDHVASVPHFVSARCNT